VPKDVYPEVMNEFLNRSKQKSKSLCDQCDDVINKCENLVKEFGEKLTDKFFFA